MKKLINIVFVFSLLFAGCSTSNEPQATHFRGNQMTIDYKIIVGSHLENSQKQRVHDIIQKTFIEIDIIYNKWNPHSEISKLNRLKKGVKVELSAKLAHFLRRTGEMVELTGGRFDPTIEPVQQLWKKSLGKGLVPVKEEIENVMEAVGFDKIHVENGLFYKDHDETSLDLGGIAKGYAVDLLVSRLKTQGFEDLFVEWGGEIKAIGKHPENRPWHIFIANLKDSDPDHAIAHLDLENQAIATSGDYLQNWKAMDGSRYFHVVDPRRGAFLEIQEKSIASVSVVADDCLCADAIATALMLFDGADEARAWGERVKEEYPEVRIWVVSRE